MTNNIKELRKARHITQAMMAKDLGVAVSTVQNWESERTEMTGYTLLMVADYFGVTPSEVYGSGTPDQARIDERHLLDNYRRCSARGKEMSVEYSEMVANSHPKSDDDTTGIQSA